MMRWARVSTRSTPTIFSPTTELPPPLAAEVTETSSAAAVPGALDTASGRRRPLASHSAIRRWYSSRLAGVLNAPSQ